jgi:gamma-glutamyltranspeptidase/glutathione hydrolase
LIDRATLSENLSLHQDLRKPAVRGGDGLVAAHHRVAAEVGAGVLRSGGNAVDAAVATGFAVGVAEPWMSGIGGIGVMLVREARSGKVSVIDFGARAPAALDPAAYVVASGADTDLFGWPMVAGRRNLVGPYAVAVPAMVAGHAMAHELFGTRPWAELVRPAAAIAEAGVQVDWHTTLWIATAFADLAADPGCRALFLPNGASPYPPRAVQGPPPRLKWPALAATLRVVAEGGPRAFYEGPIARAIAAGVRAGGGFLSEKDLAGCRAVRREPARLRYRGHDVHVAPELNGGPTLLEALDALQRAWSPAGPAPDGAAFAAYADALRPAWARRLKEMGDRSPHATSTTNFCVVDRDGNVVVVTQTLLSLFGARLLLPETGILMNNGINWFDPRPGAPNSIAPGKRVLANYTPAMAVAEGERGSADVIGLGGAGGRKILPAVFNLISFMIDYGMTLEDAMHAPRIDVSGPDKVVADRRLGDAALETIAERHPTVAADREGYPYHFTIASAVRLREGGAEAAVEPWQPSAEAVAA